jgi:hypothetical protein
MSHTIVQLIIEQILTDEGLRTKSRLGRLGERSIGQRLQGCRLPGREGS